MDLLSHCLLRYLLSIALLASQVSCAKRAARNKPTDRLTSAYLVTAADGRLLFMTTENVVVSDSKGGTVGFDRLRSLDAKTGNAVAFHMFGDSGSKGRYACAPGQNGAIWCSRGSNPVRLERRSADTLEVVADPAAIEQSDPQLASGIAEVYVDLVHSEILVVNGQGDSLVLEGAGPKVTLRSEHRGNDHFFDNFGKFRYPGDTAAETPAGQLSFAGKDGHYELLLQPKDESERRVVRTLRVEAPLFVHDRDSRRHVEHDGVFLTVNLVKGKRAFSGLGPTGKELWSFYEGEARFWGAFQIDAQVLLVLENKGGYYLQSINLKDGSVAWSLDI